MFKKGDSRLTERSGVIENFYFLILKSAMWEKNNFSLYVTASAGGLAGAQIKQDREERTEKNEFDKV